PAVGGDFPVPVTAGRGRQRNDRRIQDYVGCTGRGGAGEGHGPPEGERQHGSGTCQPFLRCHVFLLTPAARSSPHRAISVSRWRLGARPWADVRGRALWHVDVTRKFIGANETRAGLSHLRRCEVPRTVGVTSPLSPSSYRCSLIPATEGGDDSSTARKGPI